MHASTRPRHAGAAFLAGILVAMLAGPAQAKDNAPSLSALAHCQCIGGNGGTCMSITTPQGEDSCYKGASGTCTGTCGFVEQGAAGSAGAARGAKAKAPSAPLPAVKSRQ